MHGLPTIESRRSCRAICVGVVMMLELAGGIAWGQSDEPYAIEPIRWEEDYSYLRDRSPLPFPEWLKYLPFGTADYVSFGGEYRLKLEGYDDPNFGLTHTPNFDALSNRVLLHADVHIDSSVRLFVQLGYADESGRLPAERPFDNGGVNLAQGFIDWTMASADAPWRVRLGRQEIEIGRYVTVRDGTAIPRTFDGVRVDGQLAGWSVLAFGARPTLDRRQAFGDEPDPSDFAAAVVATRSVPSSPGLLIDLLALYRDFSGARYLAGLGHELRDSLGVRLHGAVGSWDVDTQVSHQFGQFTPNGAATLTIDSWGAASEGGYTFHEVAGSPRLGIRVDAAEGDRHPTDHTLQTFDLPYPNLTYLTDAAFIAPRNVWDIDPFVSAKILSALTFTVGAQFLWRLTPQDAIYSPIGTIVIRPDTRGSFVAAQPYVRASWRPKAYLELIVAGVHAIPGEAASSAGGRTQDYFATSVSTRF